MHWQSTPQSEIIAGGMVRSRVDNIEFTNHIAQPAI
jgi:hypothetical protein